MQATIDILVNQKSFRFKFDTGASVSIIPQSIWMQIGRPVLRICDRLRTYGESVLDPLGVCHVTDIQPLFGIPWILAMNFNMPSGVSFCQRKLSALSTIQHTGHENLKVSNVLGKYGDIFSDGIGIIKQRIHLPLKAISIQEIEMMIKEGNLVEVQTEDHKLPALSIDNPKQKWYWNGDFNMHFRNVKNALLQWRSTVPYDLNKPLFVMADASEHGLGDVLAHKNLSGVTNNSICIKTSHKGRTELRHDRSGGLSCRIRH
ncbi:hypothetical protein GJ496_000211 [Pomphorhynchus laevis]|nr:hypothetical protein GJ496_000207 [Pomphorhynchus laevis]KAI0981897.1 hypothetical protein GJ496_000211 [Pomphorhynchus laevis]